MESEVLSEQAKTTEDLLNTTEDNLKQLPPPADFLRPEQPKVKF